MNEQTKWLMGWIICIAFICLMIAYAFHEVYNPGRPFV